MRRLIWGLADCLKSHVRAQLYSFEASDAKSDINSCSDPVCLLSPRFLPLIWRSSESKLFSNFESRWERETSACIRISRNLEKYHRAHRLLHDSTVLMLCMLSIAFPNVWIDESFLNSIRIWSGSELWQRFFFLFYGERIQISLKAGHHRPASETPFNGVSLACRWWPNVECWLGCSENFRGFHLVLLRGPDPLPPLWIRAWDRTMYTLIEIYWKSILSCASAFVRHFAYFLSHAQIFKLTKHSFLNSIRVWSGSKPFFANVNRERKRERLVHAHHFGKIKVHRQIDK